MTKRRPPPARTAESEQLRQRLRESRNELYLTRKALIDLMPPEFYALLDAWGRVDNRSDLVVWIRWAINGVLERADKRHGPEVKSRIGEWRANCPLCGRAAFTQYTSGFAFPIGLGRHLAGSHKVYPCRVFKAAADLAREYVLDQEDPTTPKLHSPIPDFERPPKPWLVKSSTAAASAAKIISLRPRPAPKSD